ncbi:MAG: TSUP family transporter [Candidatus Aminicenantes bacterium]|nr:TSUP family transporter [Candidatus Aminicenantes bacterium]
MLVVVIGFLAGIFSGLFGIGGGIVMVPAMVLLAHFPLIKATGTSLAAILLPVGILGVMAYYRAKLIDVRGSIFIATGLVISVVVGAWLAHSLPADVMRKLYALFCLYVSWTFIKPVGRIKKLFGTKNDGAQRNDKPGQAKPGLKVEEGEQHIPTEEKSVTESPERYDGVRKSFQVGTSSASETTEIRVSGVNGGYGTSAREQMNQDAAAHGGALSESMRTASLPAGASNVPGNSDARGIPESHSKPHFLALVGVGLVAGVMAGMFGIGGGNIIVPFLILFFHYPPKRAIATSLGALLAPVGLPGVIYYYKAGTLDLRIAALLALGLVLGTVFGARINIKMPGDTVKLLYGIFLIFVALRFLFF